MKYLKLARNITVTAIIAVTSYVLLKRHYGKKNTK